MGILPSAGMARQSALEARHMAVIGCLVTTVALSAGWRLLSSPREPPPEALRGIPDCERGMLVVAWRGDGERLGCVEEYRELISLAAARSGCGSRLEEAAESGPAPDAGTRVRVMRGPRGSCELRAEPLPGAERIALGVPIDVNDASESDLVAIRGIGPVRAAAIVAERENRGPFVSVEDLSRVRGIGPVTVERVAPYVRAGSAGSREKR